MMMASTTKEVPYTELIQMLEDGKVIRLRSETRRLPSTQRKEAEGYSQFIRYYTVRMESSDQLTQRLVKADVEGKQEKQDTSMILESILSFLIPFVIIVIFMNFMMKRMGGGAMGFGKSNARIYMQKETGITFKDVAGQDERGEGVADGNRGFPS